jgi:hypothetical protein
VGESSKGNGKVKVGDNVLPVNLLPYLAEAYAQLFLLFTSLHSKKSSVSTMNFTKT